MGFKVGDKVVCVKVEAYDEWGNTAIHPIKGSELIIDEIIVTRKGVWLYFYAFDPAGGYSDYCFRKVEPFKSSKASLKLANDAMKVIEYNPLELKPTKEKVNA